VLAKREEWCEKLRKERKRDIIEEKRRERRELETDSLDFALNSQHSDDESLFED
jgi:hypothetical protein